MATVRLYRHPDCARCAGYARMHRRFDWLRRFEDSTKEPPTGPLRMGEIAIQDLATGTTLKGIAGFRLLCRHIPAYWALLPLTYLGAVRRRIERDIGGCENACETSKSR